MILFILVIFFCLVVKKPEVLVVSNANNFYGDYIRAGAQVMEDGRSYSSPANRGISYASPVSQCGDLFMISLIPLIVRVVGV